METWSIQHSSGFEVLPGVQYKFPMTLDNCGVMENQQHPESVRGKVLARGA